MGKNKFKDLKAFKLQKYSEHPGIFNLSKIYYKNRKSDKKLFMIFENLRFLLDEVVFGIFNYIDGYHEPFLWFLE